MFKRCNQCDKKKSISSFYVHARMADGYLNKCKECVKKRIHNRRKDDIENYRIREAIRSAQPHRVAKRKAYLQTERGQASLIQSRLNWLKSNQIKRQAHVIVGNAVRDKKLIKKPCKVCGVTKVQAHHEDYSKPLEVIWLCPKHHNYLHLGRM